MLNRHRQITSSKSTKLEKISRSQQELQAKFKKAGKTSPFVDKVIEELDDAYYKTTMIERVFGSALDFASQLFMDNTDYIIYESPKSRGTTPIVLNMKGKGFPNYEEVIAKAAKKIGVEKSQVSSYVTVEFLDQLINEEISFYRENYDFGYFPKTLGKVEYAIVGRSGGYHGFYLMDIEDIFEMNEDIVKESITKFEKSKDFTKACDGLDITAEEAPDNAVDFLQDIYDFMEKTVKATDMFSIDPLIKKAFDRFEKELKDTAKEWEKPDRWVELIEMNNYYNEEVEEIDPGEDGGYIDEDDEEYSDEDPENY